MTYWTNEVIVGFTNVGQREDYVTQNQDLADFYGIDTVFPATVLDDITNGNIEDEYIVPGINQPDGIVTTTYSSMWCGWKQHYGFVSSDWNDVKSISIEAASFKKLSFSATDFVQADIDLRGDWWGADINLFNLKRSNIVTGWGNDDIYITSATNKVTFQNKHQITTGKGNDTVVFDMGDESIIESSLVEFVDGSLTETYVRLGAGHDKFISKEGLIMEDNVWGGKGRDIILTGGGDDNLYGGRGRDILNGGTGKDTLTGGRGKDTFVIDSADADTITDFKVGKDTLDVSDLIDTASGPDVLANIEDYLGVSYDGTDTTVTFDQDGTGAGAAEVAAVLQGVDLSAEGSIVDLIAANVIDVV